MDDELYFVKQTDPEVAEAIAKEKHRQQHNIELIASENFVSRAVMAAQGAVLTNKYAEGYPGKRYYGGCEYVDIVERLAIERAKELLGQNMPMFSHIRAPRQICPFISRCLSRETQFSG